MSINKTYHVTICCFLVGIVIKKLLYLGTLRRNTKFNKKNIISQPYCRDCQRNFDFITFLLLKLKAMKPVINLLRTIFTDTRFFIYFDEIKYCISLQFSVITFRGKCEQLLCLYGNCKRSSTYFGSTYDVYLFTFRYKRTKQILNRNVGNSLEIDIDSNLITLKMKMYVCMYVREKSPMINF